MKREILFSYHIMLDPLPYHSFHLWFVDHQQPVDLQQNQTLLLPVQNLRHWLKTSCRLKNNRHFFLGLNINWITVLRFRMYFNWLALKYLNFNTRIVKWHLNDFWLSSTILTMKYFILLSRHITYHFIISDAVNNCWIFNRIIVLF